MLLIVLFCSQSPVFYPLSQNCVFWICIFLCLDGRTEKYKYKEGGLNRGQLGTLGCRNFQIFEHYKQVPLIQPSLNNHYLEVCVYLERSHG